MQSTSSTHVNTCAAPPYMAAGCCVSPSASPEAAASTAAAAAASASACPTSCGSAPACAAAPPATEPSAGEPSVLRALEDLPGLRASLESAPPDWVGATQARVVRWCAGGVAGGEGSGGRPGDEGHGPACRALGCLMCSPPCPSALTLVECRLLHLDNCSAACGRGREGRERRGACWTSWPRRGTPPSSRCCSSAALTSGEDGQRILVLADVHDELLLLRRLGHGPAGARQQLQPIRQGKRRAAGRRRCTAAANRAPPAHTNRKRALLAQGAQPDGAHSRASAGGGLKGSQAQLCALAHRLCGAHALRPNQQQHLRAQGTCSTCWQDQQGPA